jgi:hypothetical protein
VQKDDNCEIRTHTTFVMLAPLTETYGTCFVPASNMYAPSAGKVGPGLVFGRYEVQQAEAQSSCRHKTLPHWLKLRGAVLRL